MKQRLISLASILPRAPDNFKKMQDRIGIAHLSGVPGSLMHLFLCMQMNCLLKEAISSGCSADLEIWCW